MLGRVSHEEVQRRSFEGSSYHQINLQVRTDFHKLLSF